MKEARCVWGQWLVLVSMFGRDDRRDVDPARGEAVQIRIREDPYGVEDLFHMI